MNRPPVGLFRALAAVSPRIGKISTAAAGRVKGDDRRPGRRARPLQRNQGRRRRRGGRCASHRGTRWDIFVADGHGSNNRIVKYSKDGKFIKAWGKTGYAPGEFRVVHCIAMDKRGRVFVCDRSNTRIQIFDQEGKYLATWHQFGMPSGIAFSVNDEDLVYVFDSESDNVDNPGFEEGIRIGDALNGWVKYFILDPGGNPGTTTGSGAEFGTVDKFGNVFAGEPRPRVLRKYVKVR